MRISDWSSDVCSSDLRLVGAEADDTLHAGIDRCLQRILRPQNVGLYRLQRVEFARGNLLEGCCMEDEINAPHGGQNRLIVAPIPDVELQLRAVVLLAHVVLLLLVTAQAPAFAPVGIQKTP